MLMIMLAQVFRVIASGEDGIEIERCVHIRVYLNMYVHMLVLDVFEILIDKALRFTLVIYRVDRVYAHIIETRKIIDTLGI